MNENNGLEAVQRAEDEAMQSGVILGPSAADYYQKRAQPGVSPFSPGNAESRTIDLSGPRAMLERRAEELRKRLAARFDNGSMFEPASEQQLLNEYQSFKRGIQVLAGLFTVDGEELVDSDVPQVFKGKGTYEKNPINPGRETNDGQGEKK